jgi:hypothetical protein
VSSSRQVEAHIVVENALRWVSNILVEVQTNHSEYINPDAADKLRDAIRTLHDATQNLRFPNRKTDR